MQIKTTHHYIFPNKTMDVMSLVKVALFVFFGFISSLSAQHSNIESTTATTTGGTWNAAAPWVFTPNSDNVNIKNTDIQTKLSSGDVTIVTNNTYGTQKRGSQYTHKHIVNNSNTAGRSFTIEANDDITVSGNLHLHAGNYNYHGKTLFYALPKETYKSIISFTPIKQDLQTWEAILEVQETLL